MYQYILGGDRVRGLQLSRRPMLSEGLRQGSGLNLEKSLAVFKVVPEG
jgi:hypothetical protein